MHSDKGEIGEGSGHDTEQRRKAELFLGPSGLSHQAGPWESSDRAAKPSITGFAPRKTPRCLSSGGVGMEGPGL